MATINDVTFNMVNLRPVAVHRNSVSEQPGSDTNFITDMGYDGLVMRLEGFEETLATYDSVISEFMKSGEHTMVYRTGWQFKVYSAQLTPELIEGIVDNYFPYNLILLTSTPYRESTSETTRSKSITTNNEEWSQDDSANDIDTDGSVDAVPDIQVTGGTTHANLTHDTSDSNYSSNAGAANVTISNDTGTQSPNINASTSQGQTVNCRNAGMAIIDSVQIWAGSAVQWGNVICTVYDKVGGTSLGSKTVNIVGVGNALFTFAAPIVVVQDEENCTDSVDASKIYFKFTSSGGTDISVGYNTGYADGIRYENDSPQADDLRFVVVGNSCKEIRQTFTVPESYKLSTVRLNICKYNYAGSNSATVVVKEGATTLGTGTTALSGSTFADFDFYLEEESAHSLLLSTSTTYTIIFTPPSDSVNATSILIKTDTTASYTDGAVTLVEDGGTTRTPTHDLYFILDFAHSNEDLQVYNTADSTVKCDVANEILEGAIHRINVDGTGSVEFDDDITTQKYARTNEGMKNITYDDGNNEFDIADDGYIYWLIDTKGTVTGIPTLTAQINIATGIPTIQISTDASTWYDITTAIEDDVDTVYELDSSSLHLKNQTAFYWRIDCVKAGAATGSVKSFELDIEFVTIDFEHPVITTGGAASTIRCDQDVDSGLACTIALIYRDRSWPA